MSNDIIDQWLDTWTEEFSRAVQMFSGQAPVLSYSRAKELASGEMESLLWWKQTFEADETFHVWVGANEATWLALGAAAGDEEAEAAKAAYLEIASQTHHGVASAIGNLLGQPLRCGEGQLDAAPDFQALSYALLGIEWNGAELPSVALAIDPRISKILAVSALTAPSALALAAPQSSPPSGQSVMAPMLSRLMDLELPLSVALGRAKMPVCEVLKVTAGSLIELDKNIGDHVDLIVHGTVVARGEVVSVRGNYGVRIKEIISRHDRLSLYGNKA